MNSANPIKYSNDEVESRVKFSQKMFQEIEENIINFLNYVPIDTNHLEVYSPKLIAIISTVGPELINSFDLAVCETGFGIRKYQPEPLKELEELLKKEKDLKDNYRSLTFPDYYSFLSKHEFPPLNIATVQMKESDIFTMPFEEPYPDWWKSYNLLKHDKYNNLKSATLRNMLKATAGLFWLIDNNCKIFHFDKPFQSRVFLRNEDRRLLSQSQKI